MTIEMLIKALRKVKKQHGNIDVERDGISPKLEVITRVYANKLILDKGEKNKPTHLEIG